MIQILSPLAESNIESNQLEVKWQEETRAKNFRIELCSSESFPTRQTKIKQVDPFVYETTYEDLSTGIYYLRARAEYYSKDASGSVVTSYTNWSDTVKVYNTLSTAIDNIEKSGPNFYILTLGSNNKQLILNMDALSKVRVSLNSISGMLVGRLWDGDMPAGRKSLELPVAKLSSGVYLLVIEVDGKRVTLKLLK